MRGNLGKRHGAGAERERGRHHDQTGCLVQDHGFKAAKLEQANEQRQPKLCATKADKAA
jgi:glucuronate isomerase